MDSPSESLGKETAPCRYPLHEDNAGSSCAGEPATEGDEGIDCSAGQDEMRELYGYLDMVNKMVRPGCPPEVVDLALDHVSSLFKCLTTMSSSRRPRASL